MEPSPLRAVLALGRWSVRSIPCGVCVSSSLQVPTRPSSDDRLKLVSLSSRLLLVIAFCPSKRKQPETASHGVSVTLRSMSVTHLAAFPFEVEDDQQEVNDFFFNVDVFILCA